MERGAARTGPVRAPERYPQWAPPSPWSVAPVAVGSVQQPGPGTANDPKQIASMKRGTLLIKLWLRSPLPHALRIVSSVFILPVNYWGGRHEIVVAFLVEFPDRVASCHFLLNPFMLEWETVCFDDPPPFGHQPGGVPLIRPGRSQFWNGYLRESRH